MIQNDRLRAILCGTAPEVRKPVVSTRVDQHRRENPDEFHTWITKYGCVVQFWGFRIYYGNCADCGCLVTAKRNISGHKKGSTNIGRWPKHCGKCREKRREMDNDAARGRMRRHRAKKKDDLAAAYAMREQKRILGGFNGL